MSDYLTQRISLEEAVSKITGTPTFNPTTGPVINGAPVGPGGVTPNPGLGTGFTANGTNYGMQAPASPGGPNLPAAPAAPPTTPAASAPAAPGAPVAPGTPGAPANAPTTPNPTAAAAPGANDAIAKLPALAPGMTSNDVKTLQDWLVSQGYLSAADAATGPGIYGPKTTAAVAAWQKANNIDTQGNPGYFGPISKQFLTQGAGAGGGATGGTPDNGGMTDAEAAITAQDFYKKAGESDEQYTARIAALRGDTSTPQGAAVTSLSNNGATTTPQDFATDPIKAVTDTYTQIFDAMGLAPVKTQIEDVISSMSEIDTNLQDKIQSINNDPWISEALRSKEITQETSKANTLKADKAKILSLYQGIYDKGVQQAQFVTTQAVSVLKQNQLFDQQQTMQAIKTADTISVNSAKGAGLTTLEKNYLHAVQYDGFKGSLIDFQKEMTSKAVGNAKNFGFTAKQLAALSSKGLPSDAANNILNGIESGVPLDQIRKNMKDAGFDPGLLDSIMFYVDPANNTPGM